MIQRAPVRAKLWYFLWSMKRSTDTASRHKTSKITIFQKPFVINHPNYNCGKSFTTFVVLSTGLYFLCCISSGISYLSPPPLLFFLLFSSLNYLPFYLFSPSGFLSPFFFILCFHTILPLSLFLLLLSLLFSPLNYLSLYSFS